MRIKSINIPEGDETQGLKTISLHGLSDMVLLAGENGSGKTRILSVIAEKLRNVMTSKQRAKVIADRDRLKRFIAKAETNIAHVRTTINQLKSQEPSGRIERKITILEREISAEQNYITQQKEQLKLNLDTLAWDEIVLENTLDHTVIAVDCVPKEIRLTNYKNLNANQQNAQITEASKFGIGGLNQGSLSYIKQKQDRWYSATHQNSTASEDNKKEAIDDYSKLKFLIEKFVNVSLDRDLNDDPLVYGKPIGDVKFSNGQIILLQICVQIHAQAGNLNNLVLFLDEPENHLHPNASIDLIETIRYAAPTCQLWVATHSIPILSYFNEATLIFVKDGSAEYSGSKPEQVLKTLLGDEERIGRLQNFTNLPATLALNRYAAECLVPPAVIGESEEDDQAKQIQDIIITATDSGKK